MSEVKQDSVRVIKKYPNRRLYDTQASAYITLADVRELVVASERFKVVDTKTDEDITRSILLQIILDLESAGVPMFSTGTLKQIIRFYGHAMQGVMGKYLEHNMQAFTDIQQQLSQKSEELYHNQFKPEAWAELMSMQNPLMSRMMSNYVDQTKELYLNMQEQMQKQTQQLLNVFTPADTEPEKDE
jgi:polyhydroxyalkanoate synthesis repressor PhaR